jgi:NAD(P)H-hydrate repair Nnr-like enzyme with NAD(P)H-hydrate dehydratase domain
VKSIKNGTKPALETGTLWADEAFARAIRPRRETGAHKWGVGGVIVIAGSPSLAGAAYLASRAAGRAGAGIVRLASGRGVISMLASAMPEVAYVPLPETDAPGSARKAVERLMPSFEKCRAAVIGPGLGDDELTDHLLSALMGFAGKHQQSRANIGFGISASNLATAPDGIDAPLFAHEDLRVVLDADALKWLATQPEWWTHIPENRVVLTPHPGELAALTERPADEITANPAEIAREYAKKWRQTVVVKSGYSAASDGARTLVADDAPPSLATAGSGDVFAGAIGAFLAQGLASADAAGLALYVGTQAARTLEATFGDLGIIATDMPDAIAIELGKLS